MIRNFLVRLPVSILLLGAAIPNSSARAGDPTPPTVKADTVAYTSGTDTVRAVLFHRAGDSAVPGVVVIHEWWGLNDWVLQSARRIADRGYAVLAIDLYRGHVAASADEAHELSRGVPDDRSARDLVAAVAYLRAQSGVDAKRVGTIGWCMGGGYSLEAALLVPDLKACVVCYGRLAADDSTLAPLSAEVLGIFGADDRGIPAADVKAFGERAAKLGKTVTVDVYEGVGHAFMNSGNAKGYSEKAAVRAWTAIDGFFDRVLGPPRK